MLYRRGRCCVCFYRDGFCTKSRVLCREFDGSGLFGRADPDGTDATDESEGVVADYFAVFDGELDDADGVWAVVAEFVGHAEHDAGHVDAVGVYLGVIGFDNEITIDAFAGHSSLDHFFAADIAFDPQIVPLNTAPDRAADVRVERRVFEIWIRLAVGIGLGDEFVTDVIF